MGGMNDGLFDFGAYRRDIEAEEAAQALEATRKQREKELLELFQLQQRAAAAQAQPAPVAPPVARASSGPVQRAPSIDVQRPSIPEVEPSLEFARALGVQNSAPGLGTTAEPTPARVAAPARDIDAELMSAARRQSADKGMYAQMLSAGNKLGAAIGGTKSDDGFTDWLLSQTGGPISHAREMIGADAAKKKGAADEDARKFHEWLQQRGLEMEGKKFDYGTKKDAGELKLKQSEADERKRRNMAEERNSAANAALMREGRMATQDARNHPVQKMTAGDVAKVAELDTGLQALDGLWGSFKTNVDWRSTIAQGFPGTDTAKYKDAREATAQIVGGIMEGGKLTDPDFARYKAMMPAPDDSVERAEAKKEVIRKLLTIKRDTMVNTLGKAGFKTGGFAPSAQAPSGSNIDLTKPVQAAKPGTVLMVNPKGIKYDLDPSEVAEAEQRGWKRG